MMVEEKKSGLIFHSEVVPAEDGAHFRQVADLLREYAASLDFDLGFQNFQTELDRLPGDYAAPQGCILLALADREPIGCIALRKWSHDICEMKRLYVREKFRGHSVGRRLVQALIDKAAQIGYRRMRLDTVPAMLTARALYRSLGFRRIRAYRFNPIEGAEYMELELDVFRDPKSPDAS